MALNMSARLLARSFIPFVRDSVSYKLQIEIRAERFQYADIFDSFCYCQTIPEDVVSGIALHKKKLELHSRVHRCHKSLASCGIIAHCFVSLSALLGLFRYVKVNDDDRESSHK